ncbi:helix-turn-helix domain-containing protein [Streptomyces rugosispiralis]|uniref:Helix-turn-helix domain-containing protein n=1 Tax=Streptomyces rugosispiralis TaxID=2967341 RepID=A0ABT1UTM2_9ACTN|nr:helix-turn-helix transcriptional regulator [Streptomyces rugosispiralis]MCQ8188471.1 helix-turn-helix domain-containing protein [Streptomyces rugosispiralis]
MSATKIPGPGANVAVCRKARGFSQVALARRAGVSVSLLSKIEVGDRALTPGIAAALAQAMGLTLDELLGTAPVERADEKSLAALNYAVRRFDIPDTPPSHPEGPSVRAGRAERAPTPHGAFGGSPEAPWRAGRRHQLRPRHPVARRLDPCRRRVLGGLLAGSPAPLDAPRRIGRHETAAGRRTCAPDCRHGGRPG